MSQHWLKNNVTSLCNLNKVLAILSINHDFGFMMSFSEVNLNNNCANLTFYK